jgi:hypothetical protein
MTDERDIDQLRGDIEVTRQRISSEIEAIGERLTPEHAKEVAKEKLVEAKDRAIENVKMGARRMATAAGHTPANVGHAIRENPIPTMMVCAGAGWLLYKAFTRARATDELEYLPAATTPWDPMLEHEVSEPHGPGRVSRAKERVASIASGAKGRLGHVRDRAVDTAHVTKERAAHLAHVGREKAHAAKLKTQDTYTANPLLFGAGAIALGFGIAMMLPKTEPESRILGERRDRVLERAKSAAREAKDVAIGAAKEGVRAASRELR